MNLRYWLGQWINGMLGSQFPWATFTINVSGSFAIGFVSVALTQWLPHPNVRLFAVVGVLGGYTTFSTFASESLVLWERGAWWLSLANMAGSVMAGFLAVLLGVALGRSLAIPQEFRRSSPATSVGHVRTLPSESQLTSDPPMDSTGRSR